MSATVKRLVDELLSDLSDLPDLPDRGWVPARIVALIAAAQADRLAALVEDITALSRWESASGVQYVELEEVLDILAAPPVAPEEPIMSFRVTLADRRDAPPVAPAAAGTVERCAGCRHPEHPWGECGHEWDDHDGYVVRCTHAPTADEAAP